MSLILALGSNLGDRENNLQLAKKNLCKEFEFVAESRIFESAAVDYLNQPDFYNQVLEFSIPNISPSDFLEKILNIELKLGRKRDIPKGPRIIDIDILFWGLESIQLDHLTIPHYAWHERSFVVLPMSDLPYYEIIQKSFIIPTKFKNSATPIK